MVGQECRARPDLKADCQVKTGSRASAGRAHGREDHPRARPSRPIPPRGGIKVKSLRAADAHPEWSLDSSDGGSRIATVRQSFAFRRPSQVSGPHSYAGAASLRRMPAKPVTASEARISPTNISVT